MAIPERILVSRKGGNYSSCMGFYALDVADNQFWGQVVACGSRPPEPRLTGWRPEKRWYAVLHKFDGRGYHLGTDSWFAGVDRPWGDAIKRASRKLDEMVAALGEVEYADIEIRLFRVEIDNCTFGLVDVSQPEEGPAFAERVAMLPGDLLFHAPWDGSYDT